MKPDHQDDTSAGPVPVVPAPIQLPRWTMVLAAGVGGFAVVAFVVAYGLGRGGAASAPARSELPAAASPVVTVPVDAQPAHAEGGLSFEVTEVVEGLRERLEREPSNLDARRELAVTLVRNEQYMAAFREAETLLATGEEDPNALWVQAMVRLRMGQTEHALEMVDRVLARHPSHVASFATKGMLLLRMGDSLAAVAVWEEGLVAAGGSDPELERLLAVSRSPASSAAPRASSDVSPSRPSAELSDAISRLVADPDRTGR